MTLKEELEALSNREDYPFTQHNKSITLKQDHKGISKNLLNTLNNYFSTEKLSEFYFEPNVTPSHWLAGEVWTMFKKPLVNTTANPEYTGDNRGRYNSYMDLVVYTAYEQPNYRFWPDDSDSIIETTARYFNKYVSMSTMPGCCGVIILNGNSMVLNDIRNNNPRVYKLFAFLFKKYAIIQLADYSHNINNTKEQLSNLGFNISNLSRNPKSQNDIGIFTLTKKDFLDSHTINNYTKNEKLVEYKKIDSKYITIKSFKVDKKEKLPF